MSPVIAEFLGTMILIILGNGVVSNVVLAKTKGNNAGLIVITAGWGVAVFVGAVCSFQASGGHLNPALTFALFIAGKFAATKVLGYWIAQMLGAIVGASIVYYFYRQHFEATDNADDKLACFCNAPAIRGSWAQAMFCETVGTFVLVLAILMMEAPQLGNLTGVDGKSPALTLGAINLLPVAMLVFGIGMSLGGPTGYAINPARDLGPRIAHYLLPIPGKRDSDWGYSWIPVAGPMLGGIVAAILFRILGN